MLVDLIHEDTKEVVQTLRRSELIAFARFNNQIMLDLENGEVWLGNECYFIVSSKNDGRDDDDEDEGEE